MKQKNQAFAASSDSKCLVLICAPQGRPRFYFYFAQRSFTTSPAIISPTTDGTNATLPGISLLSVHLCSAPGGQIQWFLQLIAMSSILLSRLTVDERQRFYLDNMKTSSEHLLKLVVDLLDFHIGSPPGPRRASSACSRPCA